jgi:hypothetical protein
VRALTTAAGMRRQQQARSLHHAVDPLMVHPRQTLGLGAWRFKSAVIRR